MPAHSCVAVQGLVSLSSDRELDTFLEAWATQQCWSFAVIPRAIRADGGPKLKLRDPLRPQAWLLPPAFKSMIKLH